MGNEIPGKLFADNFPWISWVSASLVSQDADWLCSGLSFPGCFYINRHGRQTFLFPEQRAGLFITLEDGDSVSFQSKDRRAYCSV